MVRGLLLLFFLVLLLAGGYFLLIRKPAQTLPPQQLDPDQLVSLLVISHSGFPNSISWGALAVLADNLPSQPGWEIRYTAASTLARRGSPNIPWTILAEILDEERQFRNFRVRLPDGRLVPDEATARRIMISGLQAVGEWHDKQDKSKVQVSEEMKAVYAAVEKIARSPLPEMRVQAEKTKAKLIP